MKTSRREQNTGGALNLLGILVVLTFATTGCSSEPNLPTQPFSTPGAGMEVSVYPEPPTMVVLEAELGLSTVQIAELAPAHEHWTKEVHTGNREQLFGLRDGTADESLWEPPFERRRSTRRHV